MVPQVFTPDDDALAKSRDAKARIHSQCR